MGLELSDGHSDFAERETAICLLLASCEPQTLTGRLRSWQLHGASSSISHSNSTVLNSVIILPLTPHYYYYLLASVQHTNTTMKFTFLPAILALLNASTRANPASTAAADHHGEGDVDDVDAYVVVSHHADSEAVLSNANVQDDRQALEGSKSKSAKELKMKRIRERKKTKSSKQQPKSSKADAEERELCIWSEKANFDLSVVKEYVGLVIDAVNVAKLTTLTDPIVFLVVPQGVTEKRSDRVSIIIDMSSELGVDESTITIVEEQNFEDPTDGDVVAVHLDCGGVPKIVIYKDGKYQYEEGVVLKGDECYSDEQCQERGYDYCNNPCSGGRTCQKNQSNYPLINLIHSISMQ